MSLGPSPAEPAGHAWSCHPEPEGCPLSRGPPDAPALRVQARGQSQRPTAAQLRARCHFTAHDLGLSADTPHPASWSDGGGHCPASLSHPAGYVSRCGAEDSAWAAWVRTSPHPRRSQWPAPGSVLPCPPASNFAEGHCWIPGKCWGARTQPTPERPESGPCPCGTQAVRWGPLSLLDGAWGPLTRAPLMTWQETQTQWAQREPRCTQAATGRRGAPRDPTPQ